MHTVGCGRSHVPRDIAGFVIELACRLGHDTRHFNVGQYRRKQRGEDEIQDASFFDHKNPVRCVRASCDCVLRRCSTANPSPHHGWRRSSIASELQTIAALLIMP